LTTYVFFKGYGYWVDSTIESVLSFSYAAVTYTYEASGVFKLPKKEYLEYKYTGNIEKITALLPCNHSDDEFYRAIRSENIRVENTGVNHSNPEDYYL
jgi:hypothetical protein